MIDTRRAPLIGCAAAALLVIALLVLTFAVWAPQAGRSAARDAARAQAHAAVVDLGSLHAESPTFADDVAKILRYRTGDVLSFTVDGRTAQVVGLFRGTGSGIVGAVEEDLCFRFTARKDGMEFQWTSVELPRCPVKSDHFELQESTRVNKLMD